MSPMQMAKPDLLSGSGDCSGIKPTQKRRPKTQRVPIRRDNIEYGLSPARRRSQTMSEIVLKSRSPTDSLRLNKSRDVELVGTLDNLEMADVKKRLLSLREKYVARRVASTMILNAWRQRRRDVAAQKQSTEDLLEQVKLLQLQTSFLRNLRENESARRTEASVESKRLQSELEEKTNECQKSREEKEAYEVVARNLEVRVEKLQNELERVRIEGHAVVTENLELRSALGKERDRLCNAKNDNSRLVDKIVSLENVTSQQQANVDRLREIAEDLEKRLQEKANCVQQANRLQQQSLDQLRQNEEKVKALEKELKGSKRNEKKTKTELSNVRSKLTVLEESNLCLRLDCSSLKATVIRAEEQLARLNSRPWWKGPLHAVLRLTSEALPAFPSTAPYV